MAAVARRGPDPPAGRPWRLDGATGTELQRRGVPVRAPWWTTEALRTPRGRAALAAVHAAHARAGADILTANTFRCNQRALRGLGVAEPAAIRFVNEAVAVARTASAAASDRPLWVAGSLAPAADCYRPDLVPDSASLMREHAWLAGRLVEAGADLILVETMNCVREAVIAAEAGLAAGAAVLVSFVAGGGARLLSGERLAVAVRAVERSGVAAVLVNCTTLERTETCLRAMRKVAEGPIGAYANIEQRSGPAANGHVDRALPVVVDPAGFAESLARWHREFALAVVGGCCGTTPEHLAVAYARPELQSTIDEHIDQRG